MVARRIERIEAVVDAAAALVFAAAVAYALWASLSAQGAAVGALASFAACLGGLRRIPGATVARMKSPAPAPVAHLLAEADRSLSARAADELVLEDILTALKPDSRVVKLFDPDAMPRRGGVSHGKLAASRSDASAALHDALAELRRSLR